VAFRDETGEVRLEGELLAVAEAAGIRLRAETDQDTERARAAADALVQGASSAMAAGYSLSQIARAEADGKETVRHTLRADALKLVERTGHRARQMQVEHHHAIARATRLGLPMREIAQAAGVTHGTIRAINNRMASQTTGSEEQVMDDAHEAQPGEWDVQMADEGPDPGPWDQPAEG
jgi:DNA-binding CsgD family transcriptional regulator